MASNYRDFLQNIDLMADCVGYGISFDAFAKAYGVNLEAMGERAFVRLFDATIGELFLMMPYSSFCDHGFNVTRKITSLLLDNGASAKQLIAESEGGYPDILSLISDLLLENDATANDIIFRFDEYSWGIEELDFFVKNLDALLVHGLDIGYVQNLSDRILNLSSCNELQRAEYSNTLETYSIKF